MSTKENSAGLGVNNRFGPRTLPEGKGGRQEIDGVQDEIEFNFTGDDATSGYVETVKVPAGFYPQEVFLKTDVAGTCGSATTKINVGTSGSETTNGHSFTQTIIESAGIDLSTSFNGTWGAMLAAATTMKVTVTGSVATVTGGKYKIVVRGIRGSL